jgi:hypothetical protein
MLKPRWNIDDLLAATAPAAAAARAPAAAADDDRRADHLEDQVAERQRRTCGERLRGGDHREHAAAEVGAEHQAERDAGRHQPEAASVAVSSTIARLEYDKHRQHRRRRGFDAHVVRQRDQQRAYAARLGQRRGRATISCSASVIRPRPISTRPMRPAPLFWRAMKIDHADE